MASVEVSINQLPVTNQITDGDFLIVQTPNATNRLDFSDFVIGLDNTTFKNTIETNTTDIEALSSTKANKNNAQLTGDTKADAIVGNEANDGLQLRSDPEAPDGINGGSQIELYSEDFDPTPSQVYIRSRYTMFQSFTAIGTDVHFFEVDSHNRYLKINNIEGAVPPTPTGGGYLYVQNGALKYIGTSGTVTTIGPA